MEDCAYQPPELETFKTKPSSNSVLSKPPSSEHNTEHQHNPVKSRKLRSSNISIGDSLKPFQDIKPTLSLGVYPPDPPGPGGRSTKYTNIHPYFDLHSEPVVFSPVDYPVRSRSSSCRAQSSERIHQVRITELLNLIL